MKKMKKLASLVLAMAMALTLAVPALAAMEGPLDDGSITINDAIPGQTYNAYQILYLESYNPASGAYAYKANSAWESWLKNKTDYVSIDNQGYVTWVEDADIDAFAKEVADQLSGKAADGTATCGKDSTSVTISGLKLGYYLVDTSLGTICSLTTTKPTATVYEKNVAPTVTKEVEEDFDNSWGEKNDADINQVVNFRATITVQAGAENYILHDTMSSGLTYTGVTSVKIGDKDVATENYTVTTPCTDSCTFEVKFDNDYIATLTVGTKIVVSYSAILNENAVVGLPGNTNKVVLQYGDSAKPSYTPEKETITYTWDAKVIKFTNQINEETMESEEVMLAGATFKLSTDDKGNNVIRFHELGNNKYEVCAKTDCNKNHVEAITTDATGAFYIEGLDSGTYYLTETKAPAGYNILSGPVTVNITGATGEETNLTYTTVETKVENNTGAELPDTGGMGTTLFYILGGVLVIGAGVAMVTKKRMA